MKRDRQHEGDIISVERHNRDFLMIDNSAVQDPNLSLKATGLLSLLISYPRDWKISLSHLCGAKLDGRDSILSGLAELSQAGYLLYLRWRDSGGLWASRYIVFETPQLKEKYLEQMPEEDVEKITDPFSPSKAKAKKQKLSKETTTEIPQWNDNGETVMENPQWKNRSGKPTLNKDIYTNTDHKDTLQKDPPTPQGGMREISNSEIFVEEGDFRPEEEAIATPLQEPKQEAHTCQAQIPPDQINVPGGDENHSRFVTDTTAENMNTWNKIVATGAMKGERSPNPEFQEFYRQILSKTTQYKGRDCNLSHAKAALSRLWKQEPDRILAEAESWVKSKIKSSTSTQTRDAMSVPREERLARARAIQEAKQAQQQAKGA